MRQGLGTYKKVEDYIHICDVCKTKLDDKNWITYDATWSDGWDTYSQETEVCSLDCLRKELKSTTSYFPVNESVKLYMPSEIAKKLIIGE